MKCLGMFSNKNLSSHMKSCQGETEKSSTEKEKPSTVYNLRSAKVFLQRMLSKDELSKFHSDVLLRMSDDEYTNLVLNDEGLKLFGLTMFEKKGATGFFEISNNLHNMARLVSKFRVITETVLTRGT